MSVRTWVVAAALLLGLCGCRSRAIEVSGVGREVAAGDGYPLLAYRFAEKGRERSRATVFYVQGSESRSVLDKVGALGSFCAMGAEVVAVERRGVRPEEPLDEAAALAGATLERRTADHLAVIGDALARAGRPEAVILLGSSEGCDVAARLAAGEPRLTHIVLLAGGGGWTQEEELHHRVRTSPGALGDTTEADLEAAFADIRADPGSDRLWLGHPYRRWASFAFTRAADGLLRVDRPILVVHGSADASVPVESARALRDAFASAGKRNLTYAEIPGADHAFRDATTGVSKLPLVELAILEFFRDQGLIGPVEYAAYRARVKANHPELFEPGRGGSGRG